MIAKKKKTKQNNHDNSSKKPLSKRKIMILFNFQSIKYERTKYGKKTTKKPSVSQSKLA